MAAATTDSIAATAAAISAAAMAESTVASATMAVATELEKRSHLSNLKSTAANAAGTAIVI
eukprot:CAMPEP_0170475954 /NCGR_PEP_ID=MMETSP0123-20130129/17517_1 /TAXON_ID=182087 /ORGANISM="Favella ehrenbergii, Strain Fehren 1" /LENGTH=60 /DNA_ID=CAMNT_0010746805 /DNA_START=176 /DNA_END=355 /DNA_ORIENTATION=+